MYYRISGAPFTIKSADEKKEFINTINNDPNFSNHLACRGVNAEQFTGKVNGVVVCEKDNPNKIYIFNCEGNFPTLKLYQRTSSVVYVIEFPVSKKGQIILEKNEKPEEIKTTPKAAEPEPVVEQEKEPAVVEPAVEQEKPAVETEPDFIAATPFPDPFENPFFSEYVASEDENREEDATVEEEQQETQEGSVPGEQPSKKKRGRRKRS